jgi:hypothetical protein
MSLIKLPVTKTGERLTWGLALLGQDVVTLTSATLHLQFRLIVNNLAFSCYLHHQFSNRLLFRAGRSMNATPAQSPVRCASG